jgi:hypothetical protein
MKNPCAKHARMPGRSNPSSTRCLFLPLSLLAAFFLGLGCHDSSSGGSSAPAVVSGRVLDDFGDPVAGALIEVTSDPVQTTTDFDGRFLLEVPVGSHQMTVSSNGLTLCEACFSVEKAEWYDIGDMYPGRDSGCGGPTFCTGDLDCDGISDIDELAGWEVTIVLGDGTPLVRVCSSDPTVVDTDGDGLTDLEELAARTDPTRRDTDGDLLPDFSELFAYKSNPCMLDSDADARGPDSLEVSDPNLWDGYELLLLKTSPTLADTDGDGLTDWEEVHSGGISPLLADLPRMTLDIHGDPSIILNVTDIDSSQTTAITSTLEKDTEGYERTDTESTQMSIENTVKIHTELEAGTGTWPPSFNAKITTDTEFKHGYATESLSSWTETSVRESRQNYEEQTSNITNISYDDGMLWTGIKIANSSDLSFKVSDLRIVAYRMKPGGSFAAIGNLTLGELGNDEWIPFEGTAGEFILGPSAEYTDLVGADHIPAQIMRALVSNPTALLFEIGSYSLYKLDEFGNATTSFATLGETVVQRTGLIVIDFGNGLIERHMVATNVYRYPDGSGRGLKLGEALDEVIGLEHETSLQTEVPDPRRVLTRVGPVEAYVDEDDSNIRGFWVVAGTTSIFDEELSVDFDEIVIRSGERISLTYIEDSDGEGIFDREEYLLGTLPDDADSDEDGLSDYDESKVGWEVAVQGETPYIVYPDPRFADIDEDYLIDGSESFLGTDPYDWDTDGDGLTDAFDANPLVPPCLDGTNLFLSAWWDGAATDVTADDAWILDEVRSDGTLTRPEIAALLDLEPVFSLNGDPAVLDSIDVPTAGVSPQHVFTVALWMMWEQNDPLEEWGTVLTKGPRHRATYALSVSETGGIRASVYRRVWDNCWLGSWDGGCADSRYNERTELTTDEVVPFDQWTHVALTFGPGWMAIYIDGERVARKDVDYWNEGFYDHHYRTEYLHTNDDPLRIGLDQSDGSYVPDGRFRGFLDDIQYFHRELSADEIQQLYQLGVCEE